MPYRILSISYDGMLLNTRHQMLRQQGYDVVSAEGFAEAMERCRDGSFDLVIMGHSIPHKDKQALLEDVKRYCQSPVLALIRSGEAPLEGACESIDPMQPTLLLTAVQRILQHTVSQKSRCN